MTTTPEPVAIPADDYRAVLAMARTLFHRDLKAFEELQPTDAGQAHAMMLAAVSAIAALAMDERLDGPDKELDRLLAATVRMEAQDGGRP